MSEIIRLAASLNPAWMYVIIFLAAYIENIFPPSPSDVMVVFGGAMAAMERGHFLMALAAGVLGSTFGFMTMYAIGKWFGRRVLEAGKIKFIKLDSLHRLEGWFSKYGYWLIVGNRFLSGTRAVVSFFAGISALDFRRTSILSLVSSLLWYGILVYAGYSLGAHWHEVGSYLKSYAEVVSIATLLIVGTFILVYIVRRRKSAV